MYLENENIPLQVKGNQTDVVEHIRLNSENDAEELYNTAKLRLLNMWNWSKVANGPSSEFELTDSEGSAIYRTAQPGDKFKINLPTSKYLVGGSTDWVEILDIQDEFDPFENIATTSIVVRPTRDPNHDTNDIDHFLTSDATNTFVVRRIGQVVSAEIHGRNQVANLKSPNFMDKVRNLIVAMAAKLGISRSEWRQLTEGLLGVHKKRFAKQHAMLVKADHKAVA